MPKNLYSETTSQPDIQLQLASRKRLTSKEWNDLALDAVAGVDAALADRQPLEQNMAEWDDLVEMIDEKPDDFPVTNAANICIPLIPTQLESLVAYIAGQVLVPSLFMVTGNTKDAAQTAPQVERYYNAEFKRQRGDTTWFEELVDWLYYGTKDGTGYIEALWKYKKTTKRISQMNPRMEMDPEAQALAPVLDETGKPIYDKVESEVEEVHNSASLRAVPLRNVITVPASATSIEDAIAVIRVEYLYEDQLKELVNDGVLDKDEVERALTMVPNGSTELSSSPQPTEIYQSGEQVDTAGGQGSQTSKFFANRGSIEVYRIHTRQYDLDRDGTPEENVIWIHRSTRRMLGWMRYQYFNGKRPFFPFSPFKRAGSVNGFALPGRLAGLQNEQNAQRRQRLDEGNIRLSPPFTVIEGSKADENWNGEWGMNQRIKVGDHNEIQRVQMEQISQFSYMEEQIIKQDAGEYTGLQGAATGGQSAKGRSATEARQRQAASMTRTGLIAMRFRMAIRPVVNFIHDLNKQYLNADIQYQQGQQNLTLPLPILNRDYTIDVTGASDPIDAAARRTETLGAADIFMKFPAIATNPMRQYYLLRKIADTFGWADVEQIIGTEMDAQQMMQAAAAAAQQGGQPGQPGQGPPQGPQ